MKLALYGTAINRDDRREFNLRGRFDVAHRRDLPKLAAQYILSVLEIVLGLHAHPECG